MLEPLSLIQLVLVECLEVGLCFPLAPGFVVVLLYIILYIYINFSNHYE